MKVDKLTPELLGELQKQMSMFQPKDSTVFISTFGDQEQSQMCVGACFSIYTPALFGPLLYSAGDREWEKRGLDAPKKI